MWILTQSGKRILSTDDMDEIYVSEPAMGRTDFAVMIHRKTDGKPFALGFYQIRENAMTVLKDILGVQASFYSCKGGTDFISGGFQPSYVVIPPKTFKMPPDDEMAIKREVIIGKEQRV